MDLPDCPPGTEGYQDSVTEVAMKIPIDENCTKAEQEFQEHLNSLKIKLENGETRCMVERRGRDISGKWIYLCYPCAAMCSGETILQTHISGKKHKTKLAMRNIWSMSIFTEHPYILSEKGGSSSKTGGATEKILQKMAEEVDLHNKDASELDQKYNKYRASRCHIEDTIDNVKAPLVGLEYLVEHPPEEAHYEPAYICTLCSKQGHPRTIVNHMTCFWHRCNYFSRHFPKASSLLHPYRSQSKYREGVSVIMNRLAQRIEDKFGRKRPVNIDKEVYEKDKERIHQWIFKSPHISEASGQTFEEVVDVDLITSLHQSKMDSDVKAERKNRDPSPPTVAAPTKPRFNSFTRSAGRQERRAASLESLSDISDDQAPRRPNERADLGPIRNKLEVKSRHAPYADRRSEPSPPPRSRYAAKSASGDKNKQPDKQEKRPPNYDYKVKLAGEKRKQAEDSAKKTLAYHEKNPEKHPLYPEEWKKFWNRRYKEIQAEGKDPSKHDFKPEWIVYWTSRMKELHEEELHINVMEIYRKMCLSPPDMSRPSVEPKRKSPEPRRRSPGPRRRSPDPRRRSPEPRRRSPEPRRRSPEPRRRSPEPRRRSPEPRRRSPEPRRRSPESKRLSASRQDYKRDHRSPDFRRSSPSYRVRTIDLRHSPPPMRNRSRSPLLRAHSPARTHIKLDSVRRSRSPLSRRGEASRNRSPLLASHNPSAPSMQTVMISDDELKPDDGLSPWNSDNDIDSLGSLPDARSPVRTRERERSYTGSMVSSQASRSRRDYPARGAEPQDLGPAENVVATLRMLVALEDYLGSLGPKIVDLLTDALRMEKDKANSSEELLERESCVVLIETAKEKLKGAVQAGLVATAAAQAVRTAVVRAAATLHEADTRAKRRQKSGMKPAAAAPVPVAGVGEVDRSQIAHQMAAALIAQGKTDVSAEELAQLVDAVVGMAEAKKREAEVKRKVEARALAEKASRPAPAPAPISKPAPKALSGTASALQMLQSAYDENDKKVEKEEIPDAMDGLSDSDLETLLKNFNELSAEEQHSLIAYLKKLEAREPQRVERLRQYVSAAATAATVTTPKPEEPSAKKEEGVNLVTIESDDDDYTVEEVFKSVTQKVKEDQIRQEMEIVKKSLEETTKSTPEPETPKETPATADVKFTNFTSINMSSASDLLALVHASIQSTSSVTPTVNKGADVVTSNTQPRSFGDRSEAPISNIETVKPPIQKASINPMQQQSSFGNQGGYRPSNQMNMGGNQDIDEPFNERPVWEQNDNREPMGNMMDNRGSMGNMTDNTGPLSNTSDNRGPLSNMLDNRGPMNNPIGNMSDSGRSMGNISENRGPMGNMSDNRGLMGMPDNRGPKSDMSNNRGPMGNMSDNRGMMSNMSDNRGPMGNMLDNRGPMGNMSDNRGPMGNMSDNRGPMGNISDNRGMQGNMSDNRGMQGNMSDKRGLLGNMPDNRGSMSNMLDNRGPMGNIPDNRGPMGNISENRGPMGNMSDNRGLLGNMPDKRGPMGNMPDNRGLMGNMQDNRSSMGNMLDSRGPMGNMPDNRGPMGNMSDNRGRLGNMPDNRGPMGNMSSNRNLMGNMPDNRGPMGGGPMNNMQDNRGPMTNMMDNRGLFNEPDNRGGPMNSSMGQRGQFDNFGRDQFNQGPRGNFMNGRMQDNLDTRQNDMNQQYGNQGNNFRGRGGRGNFGGQMRGRGRGYY